MLYILYSSSKVNIFSMQCNLQAYNLTKQLKMWKFGMITTPSKMKIIIYSYFLLNNKAVES